MRKAHRYAAPRRKAKPAIEELRDKPESRAQAGVRQGAESPLSAAGILRLQHTIGNQAVQRLIVQRQPKGGSKTEERLPAVVASITLERQGTLDGGSRVPGHEGAIEIDSLSFGQTNRSVGSGEGSSPKQAARDIEVTITKATDSSSTALMNAVAKGERIIAARFEFLRRGDGGAVETTHSFEFSSGFVTNFSLGGPRDRPGDAISFSFEAPAAK
jgi:type VI secretion system Hcp family effector